MPNYLRKIILGFGKRLVANPKSNRMGGPGTTSYILKF